MTEAVRAFGAHTGMPLSLAKDAVALWADLGTHLEKPR